MNTTAPQPKPVKKKGPIRHEVVVPLLVFVVLFWAYFHFLFDQNMRKLIEWGGYQALGTEVNVGKFETHFFNGTLKIGQIEITSSTEPKNDSIAIGEIRFGLLWDALLRLKFVINEAAIEKIEFAKPRAYPGKVKPPEPPSNKPSFFSKESEVIKQKALDKLSADQSENIVGDLSAFLKTGDVQTQINQLKGKLLSEKMATELGQQVPELQKKWVEKQKSLPTNEKIQAWPKRFNEIKTTNFQNIQEVQKSGEQLSALIKEIDQETKKVQGLRADFDQDIKNLNAKVDALKNQIAIDSKEIQQHLRLPKLDAQAFLKSVFMQYLQPYLGQVLQYRSLAEKYLPPNVLKKGEKEPDVSMQPRPRAKGVSYEFGRQNSYPIFWLKRATISSQAGTTPYSGNISGEITNATSNQLLTRQPTILKFGGNFPANQINGLKALITIDQRQVENLISFNFGVGQFPIEEKQLLNQKDFQMNLQRASGSLNVDGSLKGFRDLNLKVTQDVQNSLFGIKANDLNIENFFKNVFASVQRFKFEASIRGVLPEINLDMTSDLTSILQKGFEREFSAKINEIRAQVEKQLLGNVNKQKADIEGQINSTKAKADQEIAKIQGELDKNKKQAENKTDSSKKDFENKAKGKVEQEAKKGLDDLKKKLGF